jgi:hypothetical protein
MKLTEFTTPTGQKGNLLSPSSWINMIIGVVVFLIAIAIGQNMVQKVGSKLPIDTTIDPFIRQPAAASNSPMRERY